jgi:hypothetical protein
MKEDRRSREEGREAADLVAAGGRKSRRIS